MRLRTLLAAFAAALLLLGPTATTPARASESPGGVLTTVDGLLGGLLGDLLGGDPPPQPAPPVAATPEGPATGEQVSTRRNKAVRPTNVVVTWATARVRGGTLRAQYAVTNTGSTKAKFRVALRGPGFKVPDRLQLTLFPGETFRGEAVAPVGDRRLRFAVVTADPADRVYEHDERDNHYRVPVRGGRR